MRSAVLASLLVSASACEPSARGHGEGSAAVAPLEAEAEDTPRAVLVELYTSQGCSSCPPADALLRELVLERPSGVPVVPLAFHVDYWDGLGWPDPFGDPRWSERQQAFAKATGSAQIYTPQLLFDGVDRRVGTRRARAEAAVEAANAEPAAVALRLAVTREGEALRVSVTASRRAGAEARAVDVMVAVTDGGHHTAIPIGENAGLTLAGDFVVRDLARACMVPADVPEQECEATLSLSQVRRPDALRIVAFGQDRETWRIVGVATG